MPEKKPPRKVVNLRLDPELHARLVTYADRTERSANAAATVALRTFLDQEDTARAADQAHPTTP
jgi:predicted transcriptional regulator